MASLGTLDDLDLTTVELADGTPLLAEWRARPDGTGTWVARSSLPASAVAIEIDPMRNLMAPDGFYPASSSLADLVTTVLRDGFTSFRRITDDDPGGPSQSLSCLLAEYRRALGVTEVGSNGSMVGLTYGRPGKPAGGFANLTTLVAEVRGSEDPANEIGGCIASLQIGKGGDPAPTATLWGSSYTLRGPVGRQPGGLMAYTAVVQNHFDGSGSRSVNYGYAALTRPGIGDGADYHAEHHDPIRNAPTHPVDLGFVVCGDSGPSSAGGQIGFRVAFQAGGGASPWSSPEHWRSKIGTGLVVRDWVEGGVHVHPPHPDAAAAPQIRVDRRDTQGGNLLECRTEDTTHVLAAIRPDGRIFATGGEEPSDLVNRAQLDHAIDTLRAELHGAGIAGTSTRALGRELVRRTSPTSPTFWRTLVPRTKRVGRRLLNR
jgi:hypothetical protein